MATKRAASADVNDKERSSKKATASTKAFRFQDEHIENLISCLLNYKIKCELDNIDFDADKPAQYSKIREGMADIYKEEEDFFGPLAIEKLSENATKEEKALFNEQKKLFSRGYKRIQEKIKEIREICGLSV